MASHRLPAAIRAPFEARTWRAFGYVLIGLPLSICWFALSIALVSTGAGLLITFLGVPILAGALAMCRGFGAVERARARGLLDLDVAAPEPVRGRTGGAFSWMGAMLKSGASWRHLLYAILHMPWAVFSFSITVALWAWGWSLFTYPLWQWVFPTWVGQDGIQLYGDRTHAFYLDAPFELAVTSLIGLVFVLVGPWVLRGLVSVDRLLVSGLLGPSRLASRVTELESDRGVVVDTAAADLRRIERDLHDGAQARLVGGGLPVRGPRLRGRGPAGPAGAGDRGHRVLHGLGAPPERLPPLGRAARMGGRVAHGEPADASGAGRRGGGRARGGRRRPRGPFGTGGGGGRGAGGGLAGGRADDGDGGTALAGVARSGTAPLLAPSPAAGDRSAGPVPTPLRARPPVRRPPHPVVGSRSAGARGVPPARAKPRAWGRVGTTERRPRGTRRRR